MTEADAKARQIAVLTWAVHDTLQAAETIANRAGEQFLGEEALILFERLRQAIGELRRPRPAQCDDRDGRPAAVLMSPRMAALGTALLIATAIVFWLAGQTASAIAILFGWLFGYA